LIASPNLLLVVKNWEISSQVRQELAFIPWVQKKNICYELGRSPSQGLVPRNSQVSINADSYDLSCNYDQS